MKNLFIDSNVWLSLYHFTNDDLAQFSKLKELIGTEIKLFVPQQVFDEVQRNREVKLKDAFKTFEVKPIQFPVFCKEYPEYSQFDEDYKAMIIRYKEWRRKIDDDVKQQTLPADITIKSFFDSINLIPCESVVENAYRRYRIGNPPGKDNKYGDAINWECLLNNVPNGEDLYLISADKDYCSEMFDDSFNPYLQCEWESKKSAKIYFYKNLVPFLNEHFRDIELKTEREKQELIKKLENSYNFENTHEVIAMLNQYTGWTDSQIEEICAAAENNSQVGWILGDFDVLTFYSGLLSNIKYEQLSDCSTKRIMESLFNLIKEKKNKE